MTFASFFFAAVAPVMVLAAWALYLLMREAARVHSFDREFAGMHFE